MIILSKNYDLSFLWQESTSYNIIFNEDYFLQEFIELDKKNLGQNSFLKKLSKVIYKNYWLS